MIPDSLAASSREPVPSGPRARGSIRAAVAGRGAEGWTERLPGPAVLLRSVATLTRIRIAALSTLSTATGYVAFAREPRWGMAAACGGVLLLSSGASALNQWQERKLDARMERTRERPLPAGILSPPVALSLAPILVVAGGGLLLEAHGFTALLLGLFAIGWYNGVYTQLKRVTALAAVPGALIGAVPPAIGWIAGGGSLLDARLACLVFFFFIWQVPHFWLLLLLHGREYERAGLPALTALVRVDQLARMTLVWMLTSAATALLFPGFGLVSSPLSALGLLAGATYLGWHAVAIARRGGINAYRAAFYGVNAYALIVMSCLAFDPCLARITGAG